MCTNIVWHEWVDEDGSKTGLMMFPSDVSERDALHEVGMDGRPLEKTAQRSFKADQVQVCAYHMPLSASISLQPPRQMAHTA